jgi:hypothetical protein
MEDVCWLPTHIDGLSCLFDVSVNYLQLTHQKQMTFFLMYLMKISDLIQTLETLSPCGRSRLTLEFTIAWQKKTRHRTLICIELQYTVTSHARTQQLQRSLGHLSGLHEEAGELVHWDTWRTFFQIGH